MTTVPHGRLLPLLNSDQHCSFLRVVVPYQLFPVGDRGAFKAALESIRSNWDPGDVKRVGLEPHVERHVSADRASDQDGASCALAAPRESWLRSRWKMGTAKQVGNGVDFEISDITLFVSVLGFAYLAIEVRPRGDDAGDLLDLTHRLRLLNDRAPQLARDGVPVGVLDDVADELISSALGEVPDRAALGLAYPAYVAAFISAEGMDDRQQAEFRQRLRRMFHRRQPVDAEDLGSDFRHPDRLYRRNQWFFHSQDGGGFVAIDPPSDEFSRNNMSDHLRKAYFFGFEFALLQRHALMAISGSVADDWARDVPLEARAAFFRAIREQLLLFTARFRFAQIMSSQNRHADYRRWLEVLEIEELHGEVRTEVSDMHGYLEELRAQEEDQRRTLESARLRQEEEEEAARIRREDQQRAADLDLAQKRDRMFGVVAALFVIPSLVIGFLGISIDGVTTGDGLSIAAAVSVVAASISVSVIVALLLVSWTRSRSK